MSTEAPSALATGYFTPAPLPLIAISEVRIDKKLSPFVGFYQQTLDKFLGEFWDYYQELVAYRDSPNPDTKQELKSKFCQLFGTETGYKQLDERKKLTAAKESELLLILSIVNSHEIGC